MKTKKEQIFSFNTFWELFMFLIMGIMFVTAIVHYDKLEKVDIVFGVVAGAFSYSHFCNLRNILKGENDT